MARKADYGRGHQAFLEYEKMIVNHPSYAGMPDVYTDTGDIQWEAPSNRTAGRFKDTHHKRRDWWRNKAAEIGIDPTSNNWISKTAKQLHPTKHKPCKKCGRIMDIRYVYPTQLLLRRIAALTYLDERIALDPLEDIISLLTRLVEQYGDQVFDSLPQLLRSGDMNIPSLGSTLSGWTNWLVEDYIPREPKTLSPGAMSNAPDRLDGFHSFNLCCRSSADLGRSKENLRTYLTDRRVFEYWVDGDWIAADRMMGNVRLFPNEPCANGHPGPCQADHIGPISLGFCHRPEFRLLCGSCNSGKNNRMTYRDISSLREAMDRRAEIVSWYAKKLWVLANPLVTDDETALRLSKLLRDNRHSAMMLLNRILSAKHYLFLTTFLNLEMADRDVKFSNLRIVDHVTKFSQIEYTPRTVKYAQEQKARRLRVAFISLREYLEKENRNGFVIATDTTESKLEEVVNLLNQSPSSVLEMNQEIEDAIGGDRMASDSDLQHILAKIDSLSEPEVFIQAKKQLTHLMDEVAQKAVLAWQDDRYVRTDWQERV